ncbi:MAG: hypothetical protein U0269_36220 [Polyangiales bacterium]
MQTPSSSPYRAAGVSSALPVFSFRVYPTPTAPLVLDAVVLVLVVAGVTIGAPVALLALLLATVMIATRRFVVVDHQRRELRVMVGHPSVGLCSSRHALDRALVEVRAQTVRTVHKQNGRTIGTSSHDEHILSIDGNPFMRTRSSAHAHELAAQLCYAIDSSVSAAPPARSSTLQLAIARVGLTALTLAALARTPVAAVRSLRFSPFASLAQSPVVTAATIATIVLFSAALGVRLARVLHDPCAPGAEKTARISAPAIATLAAIAAIAAFFSASAAAESGQRADLEARLAYNRRVYGESPANYAPTPPPAQLPETPPTVSSLATRCATISSAEAERRLEAVGFDVNRVTLQEGSPNEWGLDVRHPHFGITLRWYSLDGANVSGAMLDGHLVVVRGPSQRTRARIVDAFVRDPSQNMIALMRSLRLEPIHTNSSSIRGRDRSGLYWLADVRPDPDAPWLHNEREALTITGYALGQTARETANAWATYAASLLCTP